jgi:dynein heavy chain
MLKYILQAFSVVFQKAIERAEPSDEVKERVENLIDCITYSVFMYTTRGLFECDKLIFTTQMAFQVSDRNIDTYNRKKEND